MIENNGKIPCSGAPVDGVCGLHLATEERRNTDRNRLSDLKHDFEVYKEEHKKEDAAKSEALALKIDDLKTFKNRVMGLSILATLFVGGSYGWINTHIVATDIRHSETSRRVEEIRSGKDENKTDIAVVVSRVDTTNQRLVEILSLMRKDRDDFNRGRNNIAP